jgi:predicted secreted hydrolase
MRRAWIASLALIVTCVAAICVDSTCETGLLVVVAGQTQAATATRDSPRNNGWMIATPDRAIALPADHVSHPDYKIEWWYYTGNLDTREGRRFGYQLTFFRVGVNRTPPNASRWAVRDLHMAHFAVSDLASGRFHVFDRLQREGAGWAGAATDRYAVWNGTWAVRANPDGSHHLQARDGRGRRDDASDGPGHDVALDLTLTNTAR